MKLACLLITFYSVFAPAATRVRFLPMDTVFVSMTEKDIYGNSDSDTADLYSVMNVSEQDSSMGKGKSIVTPEKDLTLICTQEKKTCTVLLRKSGRTSISPDQNYASIRFSGNEAAELTSKFKINHMGEAYFQTTDKHLRLNGTSENFILEIFGDDEIR